MLLLAAADELCIGKHCFQRTNRLLRHSAVECGDGALHHPVVHASDAVGAVFAVVSEQCGLVLHNVGSEPVGELAGLNRAESALAHLVLCRSHAPFVGFQPLDSEFGIGNGFIYFLFNLLGERLASVLAVHAVEHFLRHIALCDAETADIVFRERAFSHGFK